MNKTLCTLLLAGCTLAAAQAAEPNPSGFWHGGHDTIVYPKHARPFGRSMNAWAELSVQWIYAQPFASNPFFDATGANCAVNQHGPVWFLAPIASMAPGNFTRYCTIPRRKAVLLDIGFVSDTWPCPDPDFGPRPGQSLYGFLAADSKTYMMLSRLDVSLDGKRVPHARDFVYTSEDLFAIKGDPSLQTTFDACITGSYQPAVVYGYFMMFKPLSPGLHTLVRRTVGTDGMVNTFTYFLDAR